MKNIQNIVKRTFAVLGVLVLFTACQSSLEDIFDNPNAVTTIDDAALFTNAVRSLVFQTNNTATYRYAAHHAHY